MNLEISTPSKTFITGEYLALFGGPSLVLCTEPRFKLRVSLPQGEYGQYKGFHYKSPAGKLYTANEELLKNYEIEFIDPIDGRGGLGASSAQFVTLYTFIQFLSKKGRDSLFELDAENLWNSYREICSEGNNDWLPSGADVVAQMVGGICQFEWKNFSIKSLDWDFEGLDFCILKTNKKVNTHEHLKNLGSIDLEKLKQDTAKSISALVEGDSFQFVTALQAFYKSLLDHGLVCENTQNLVDHFNSSQSVVGVKGCGALGADTLFILCESKNIESVKSLSQVVGLEYVASLGQLGKGLDIKFQYEYNRQRQIRLSQKSGSQRRTRPEGMNEGNLNL